MNQAVKSEVVDLDNDLVPDVFMSKAEGSQTIYMAWYRHNNNPTGGESAWTRFIIEDNVTKFHAVGFSDFDSDGDQDLIAAKSFGESGVTLYENDGTGTSWVERVIDADGSLYVVSIADLEGDGDLDLVGPAMWQGPVYRYLNQCAKTGGIPTNLPPAPGGLMAAAVSEAQIDLSWQPTPGAAGLWLERRQAGSFDPVGTLPGGVTSYADPGLAASTVYEYRLFATNFLGDSPPSTIATATTLDPDLTPPTTPAVVQGWPGSYHRIRVTWTPSSDNAGVAGYEVLRNGVVIGTATTTF